MTTRELLLREISSAPEPILAEVYHYLKYLNAKYSNDRFDGLAESQSVLARDWNSPEEDAAWANL